MFAFLTQIFGAFLATPQVQTVRVTRTERPVDRQLRGRK
tara:strand:- start:34 stop:150 length:117 start_codon:yes stop_codon:yes gene_type:complete